MPAIHPIASEAATEPNALAAAMAHKAAGLRASVAEAGASFSLPDATAAALRVVLGLYGLVFFIRIALVY